MVKRPFEQQRANPRGNLAEGFNIAAYPVSEQDRPN